MKGGLADKAGTTPADVNPKELMIGIEIEMEHTDNRAIAEQIALDHLTEHPMYYTYLTAMERIMTQKGAINENYSKGLRMSKRKVTPSERQGLGLGGSCVCPACGYSEPHDRNKPCVQLKCPKCNQYLTRRTK
jgi:hypothetical protein